MSGPSQTDILAALAAGAQARAANPPTTIPFASLPAGTLVAERTAADADGDDYADRAGVNARRIYCPREGCGCVVIGAGAVEYVEGEAGILPLEDGSPFTTIPSTAYWHVRGSPFAFDNIGFSKATSATLPEHAPGARDAPGKVKWLICAECDIGPLGWSFEGGSEAWLAADRLRYGEVKK